MTEQRPSLWAVRVELGWWMFTLPGVLLASLLGAHALARIGACRFTHFDAAALLICSATILLLRPPYKLAAVSGTLVTAGVIGILRTLGVVLRAVVDGEGIPDVSGGYLIRGFVYGAYLLGYWYVNRIAEKALEQSDG